MRNGRQSECVWEISVPFVDVQKRETKEGKERGKGEEESHGHQEIAPRDIITRRRSCGCDSWPSAKAFSTTTSVRLWFCCPFLSNSSCSLTEKKNLRWIQQIVFFFLPLSKESVECGFSWQKRIRSCRLSPSTCFEPTNKNQIAIGWGSFQCGLQLVVNRENQVGAISTSKWRRRCVINRIFHHKKFLCKNARARAIVCPIELKGSAKPPVMAAVYSSGI